MIGRMTAAAVAIAACLAPIAAGAGEAPAALEAVTAGGEKVLLHPNGRWEYVDPDRAQQAKKIADQFPENRMRPEQAQGGLFGIGRTLLPGDKDYNRGSLNPKMR